MASWVLVKQFSQHPRSRSTRSLQESKIQCNLDSMASKRLADDIETGSKDKRIRRLPSFATVIKDALMANYLKSFCTTLEPMIRRVVNEEVESGLVRGARMLQRSQVMQIESPEASPSLHLVFKNPLSLPIFTGSKIEDVENCPLEILLVDARNEACLVPSPLRIEVVVIDGDFHGEKYWSASDFSKAIVKERTGRRPLLAGDVALTMRRDAATSVIGELTFTDNSSWIRSRNFRIGARVAPGSYQGPRIREALTEPFMVKDHRGELYRKHYPPSLHDEVWRLERIGKDGVFHRKLAAAEINTVQDLLKLWTLDPDLLRRILGPGMSDRIWEGTIAHARTCFMGDKCYLYRWACWTLLLSPVCEVLGVLIDGIACKLHDLNRPQQAYAQQMAIEACRNWDSLEEMDGLMISDNSTCHTALLPNHVLVTEGASSSLAPYQHESITPQLQIGAIEQAMVSPNSLQLGFSDSVQNNTSCLQASLIQW